MEIIIAVFIGIWLMAASILSSIWLRKEFRPCGKKDSQKTNHKMKEDIHP